MKFREYVKKQQSEEFWKFFKSKVTDDYNCAELSYNKNVTWDIFNNNREYFWDIEYLSYNPNITFEIVKANPDINWD